MKYIYIVIKLYCVIYGKTEPIGRTVTAPTRRILKGKEVGDTRPYMVYLRPAPTADAQMLKDNWLCGGVIIHDQHILTSAACIEDAKQFFVVSGTNKWIPPDDKDNECIKYGAKKAVWKCVPKSYDFDGAEFDNMRWMSGDIAVVRVEDNFNFYRRVRGCDYVPKKIAFNNQSSELENAKILGSSAGWGSVDHYADITARASVNSPVLLETDVVLISKKNCKKRWEPRYHTIIDESMICVKDDSTGQGPACAEQDGNCQELVYSEEDDDDARRFVTVPKIMEVHSAGHQGLSRRTKTTGGFCENDHGGPLVVGMGKGAVVVGVISACLTVGVNKKCSGPYLYTSVWKHRHLISCAIDKDFNAPTCRRVLRTAKTQITETTFNWRTDQDKDKDGQTDIQPKSKYIVETHVLKLLNDKPSNVTPISKN